MSRLGGDDIRSHLCEERSEPSSASDRYNTYSTSSYRSNAEVHSGPGDPPDRGIPLHTFLHQQKLPPVNTRGRGPGGGGGEEAGGQRVQAALLQLHLTFVRTPARTKWMQML